MAETPSKRKLPADVNAETLSRFPPLRRENVAEEQRASFDALSRPPQPGSLNLAGLKGPGGVWIRMPRLGKANSEINRVLRTELGLDPRLVEVAILAAAREMSSQFEWTMHEPVALKKGVPQSTVDIIKHRKPVAGVPQKEAALIELAREAIGAKKVSPATYARALEAFGEQGLLHYVALMANYAMTAIVLTVFDQQLHDGQAPLLP
jgi:4-carboxymuconolactone decarboxylase